MEACRASVAAQGELVRRLKQQGGAGAELKTSIAELLALKKKLAELEKANLHEKPLYTRCHAAVENLARRRAIFFPSFEIYGGAGGLYDWGPPGCALKSEVEALWRRHFVLEEDMLEVCGTCLTPDPVLRASGHADRFCDLMTSDTVTGDCFRADKLLEDFAGKYEAAKGVGSLDQPSELALLARKADGLTADELFTVFEKYDIRSPITGNVLSRPFPFNLMFKTRLGPKEEDATPAPTSPSEAGVTSAGGGAAFLRPETAQGIFVNFKRLLDYAGGRVPFAAAQLGLGFRNEIAPRNALLRVREFQMAEIEHFVDPESNGHARFSEVRELRLPLYPRENQLTNGLVERKINLGEAVGRGMIRNESLAYFLGRTFLFLTRCGIQPAGLRFRQHLETEMAHYAADCWDAEIECSYGWIECVGHADRSAFDLSRHACATGQSLVATRKLAQPRREPFIKVVVNKSKIGAQLKKDASAVISQLEKADEETKGSWLSSQQGVKKGEWVLELPTPDKRILKISDEMVSFEMSEKVVHDEQFVPSVIEPSFGIGRIIYCLLEHTFRSRGIEDQEERCYFSFPPLIAPFKCSVLSLSANAKFFQVVDKIVQILKSKNIATKKDISNATIGRRYARTDEIGIPFAITVDFETLEDQTVTLRERDSMNQTRLPISSVAEVLQQLVDGSLLFEKLIDQFGKVPPVQ